MKKFNIVRSLVTEYGILWAFNRLRYSMKLWLLQHIPALEGCFEQKTGKVQRIDIFDLDMNAIAGFLSAMEEGKKRKLIEKADMAISGKFQAFSSQILDYGEPMRWNFNPLTGQSVDKELKWYRIPDFDKDRGDIKVIWEASRFSHFYLFSRAYLLTGDKKYYKAFHRQVTDWAGLNIYSFGPNYKCGQECALRMVNLLMNYTIFRKAGLADVEDEKVVKIIVLDSYKKILSNFFYADKCIKNNHTISELLGMAVGAWCCEDLKRMSYVYRKMDKVIKEQFFDDGGYRQYSFNYQRLALQDIECLLSLSGKTGHDLSNKSKNRILKSVQMLYQVQADNGDVPNYGSNDGALVFPVTECGYRDFRPTIQALYVQLTGKKVYEFGLYDEELLWFSKKKPTELCLKEIKRETKAYKDTGLYSFRMRNQHMMLVLNDFYSRPSHFDQLHLDLWVGNKNIFCDSGTYSYASDLGKKLSGTEGHNTVVVDGYEQMNLYGAFLVYDWTKRKKLGLSETSFEGAFQSRNGYTHQRSVNVKKKENSTVYEISDSICAKHSDCFRVVFHTPFQAKMLGNDTVVIKDSGKVLCILKGNGAEVEESKCSLYYMKTVDTYRISFMEKIENGKAFKKTIIEVRY